jgi:hypothetical protein
MQIATDPLTEFKPRVVPGDLVHVEDIRKFSDTGFLYRSFDHLIAAKHGEILLVPIANVYGQLSNLVDGCPVPWEEVTAVLESPGENIVTMYDMIAIKPFMELLGPHRYEIFVDHIALYDGHPKNVTRCTHRTGIRYAITNRQ